MSRVKPNRDQMYRESKKNGGDNNAMVVSGIRPYLENSVKSTGETGGGAGMMVRKGKGGGSLSARS